MNEWKQEDEFIIRRSDLCWKLHVSQMNVWGINWESKRRLGGHTNRSWWSLSDSSAAGPVLPAAVVINRERNRERKQLLSESRECSKNHSKEMRIKDNLNWIWIIMTILNLGRLTIMGTRCAEWVSIINKLAEAGIISTFRWSVHLISKQKQKRFLCVLVLYDIKLLAFHL